MGLSDGPVPLFPLPNVVLLPGATLPLQIFEPRYRSMVRDAIEGDQLIAMALLRPGYEAYYHTNLAEVHPVVCVGRIREHVQIPDGRYFINLVGECRARIREEDRAGEYRQAMLDPMVRPTTGIQADGEFAARAMLAEIVRGSEFDGTDGIRQARGLLDSDVPLDGLVDLLAGLLLPFEAVDLRQRVLEELNLLRRSDLLVRELRTLARTLDVQQKARMEWPRFGSLN